MTVTTATNASSTQPAVGGGNALTLHSAWGSVSLDTKFAPADTLVMCKLPKGAIIVGGALLGEKWDSSGAGTACMTLNIGVDQEVVTPQGTTVPPHRPRTALRRPGRLARRLRRSPAFTRRLRGGTFRSAAFWWRRGRSR